MSSTTFIEDDVEIIHRYTKLLEEMKRNIFISSFSMGILGSGGFLFIGILNILLKQDLLTFFGALVYIFLSFQFSESIANEPDARVSKLCKYWTIAGFFLSFLIGADISLLLLIYMSLLLYSENLKLFMIRSFEVQKQLFIQADKLLSPSFSRINYNYLNDRIRWNNTQTANVFTVSILAYAITYLLTFSQFSKVFEYLQVVGLLILAIYGVPRILRLPKKDDDPLKKDYENIKITQ